MLYPRTPSSKFKVRSSGHLYCPALFFPSSCLAVALSKLGGALSKVGRLESVLIRSLVGGAAACRPALSLEQKANPSAADTNRARPQSPPICTPDGGILGHHLTTHTALAAPTRHPKAWVAGRVWVPSAVPLPICTREPNPTRRSDPTTRPLPPPSHSTRKGFFKLDQAFQQATNHTPQAIKP